MSVAKKRVVVADDHPVLLAGIRALIDASGDFEVVGEAASGAQALAVVAETRPDLVMVDLSMPGMSGVEVVATLARTHPNVAAIVLSAHEESAYVQQVIRAGGRGYILKRSAPEELVRALRAVTASGVYIDPSVAARMLGTLQKPVSTGADLSEREDMVIRAAAKGYSNKEIALSLELSVKTVETYKARAMDKLSLKSRADLMRHAATQGWMSQVTNPP